MYETIAARHEGTRWGEVWLIMLELVHLHGVDGDASRMVGHPNPAALEAHTPP